jgi:hypothetical protein
VSDPGAITGPFKFGVFADTVTLAVVDGDGSEERGSP